MIKWRKKQIRNNIIEKPQNESMRKHKLTLKTMVIFRFWHFKNMAKERYSWTHTCIFPCWKIKCLVPFLQIIFLFCLNYDRTQQIFNGLWWITKIKRYFCSIKTIKTWSYNCYFHRLILLFSSPLSSPPDCLGICRQPPYPWQPRCLPSGRRCHAQSLLGTPRSWLLSTLHLLYV